MKVILYLECDIHLGFDSPPKIYGCSEGPTCVYHFRILTHHACPVDTFSANVYNPSQYITGSQMVSQTQLNHAKEVAKFAGANAWPQFPPFQPQAAQQQPPVGKQAAPAPQQGPSYLNQRPQYLNNPNPGFLPPQQAATVFGGSPLDQILQPRTYPVAGTMQDASQSSVQTLRGMPQSSNPVAPLADHHHSLGHTISYIGWWLKLIIMSFCVFIFYMLAGSWYNMRVQHMQGSDAIPHIKFWREVPALMQV
eukprot:Filipodium_phascolosomae@DN253_c0_g1_i2.p1